MQVGLGGSEFLPVPVQHGPVVQDTLHPDVILAAAQQGQGGLVVAERLAEPSGLVQDRAPLGLRAGPPQAPADALQRRLDLQQRLLPPAAHNQGVGQCHLGLGRQLCRARAPPQPDGGPQVTQGGVGIFQVQGGHAQRPFGDGQRCEVTCAAGLAGHGPRQRGRLGGIGLNQPDRVAGLLIQGGGHSQS